MTRETMPLVPTGKLMLICKSILPRLGDTEDLPTTQKQTQESSQNEKTKKHAPRIGQNSRKITKRNEDK